MGKTITTSILPNMQSDDIRLAFKFLFVPWRWIKGSNAQALESEFAKWLGVKKTFSFVSARGALYAILRAAELNEGDEVLLQAYTCVAVVEPILAAGLKPVYVDIDERDFNIDVSDIEKKITFKSRAIIVQHTFGSPADMDRIVDLARRKNLLLVEDCAHAMGAKYGGKFVGTFGDAAIFSFGRDKVLSSVWGGIAAVSNDVLLDKMKIDYRNNEYPGFFWVLQQLAYPGLFSVIRPTFSFFGRYLLAALRKISFISSAVCQSELAGDLPEFAKKKLPDALAGIARRQFAKLEKFNRHRIEIANFYASALARSSYVLPRAVGKAEPIFLRYTLRQDNPEQTIDRLRTKKIFLGNWYDSVITPKKVDLSSIGYVLGNCPKAEAAAASSFNLPTHINITVRDAKFIADNL